MAAGHMDLSRAGTRFHLSVQGLEARSVQAPLSDCRSTEQQMKDECTG